MKITRLFVHVMFICSYHVTYAFQSESTLYSCLNIKELLAPLRRHEIWSLNGCNWTRTLNHLVHKWRLSHLAKLASLAKLLSVCLWTKWLWVWVQLQSVKNYVNLIYVNQSKIQICRSIINMIQKQRTQ